MKTFRYPKGHEAGKTMTVLELKKKLESYPDDMPVLATYEEMHGYVVPDSFSVDKVSKGYVDDECDCLIIDVERY